MKNPNSAREAGAFRVTSTATVVRAKDDTCGPEGATAKGARFFWDRRSHSVEPCQVVRGRVCYE